MGSIHRAARVCRVLAFAVGESCSIYDHSLQTTGPDDPDRDAEASDVAIPSETSDNSDAGSTVDAAPPVEDHVDDVAYEAAPRDTNASDEDTGTRFDAADANPEDSTVSQERPTGITLAGIASPSGQRAPSGQGSAFSQTCMPNNVVIGYTGTIDGPDAAIPVLRTFQAVCGSLSVTSGTTFAVTTTTAETLAVVGTRAGLQPQVQLCPSNEMLVGFGGRSGSDIDQIAIICAPLTISGSSADFVLSVGNADTRPGLGGQGVTAFAAINCPAGMVAVGNEGRAASTINAFGLLCKAPMLVVQ